MANLEILVETKDWARSSGVLHSGILCGEPSIAFQRMGVYNRTDRRPKPEILVKMWRRGGERMIHKPGERRTCKSAFGLGLAALLVASWPVEVRAASGPIEFREGSLKVLTPNGDQKKVIVRVWPEAGRVDVLYQDGTPYMSFTKEDFEKNEKTSAVTYSYSKHHRTKTLIGTAIVFWPLRS